MEKLSEKMFAFRADVTIGSPSDPWILHFLFRDSDRVFYRDIHPGIKASSISNLDFCTLASSWVGAITFLKLQSGKIVVLSLGPGFEVQPSTGGLVARAVAPPRSGGCFPSTAEMKMCDVHIYPILRGSSPANVLGQPLSVTSDTISSLTDGVTFSIPFSDKSLGALTSASASRVDDTMIACLATTNQGSKFRGIVS